MNKLMPLKIKQLFSENPEIGRDELARKADISNQLARYYVKLNKDIQRASTDGSIKRGVALFDIHAPDHDKRSMSIVYQFLEDFKPHMFVLGGDQMHLDCISHHNKGKLRLTENARLKRDYNKFQSEILDKFDNILSARCKKYFMIGNHEYWIERLIDDNPQLEGLVEIENNLNLKDYELIPFNEVLTIGEVNFIHGFYTNKYFAEKNVRIYGKNIFCGHLHSNQVFTSVSPIDTLPKSGVGIGCLCNANPQYMYNKPNAWVHQFMFWYEFPDGSFTYYTPIIINGKCVINNKVYIGKV